MMEFSFECNCGEKISDFTRGVTSDVSTQIGCSGCDSRYGLTITPVASESPSYEILRVVAAISNTRMEELPTLAYSIDPDAVDQFLSRTVDGTITFEYCGMQIQVDSDALVLLYSDV